MIQITHVVETGKLESAIPFLTTMEVCIDLACESSI